MCESCGKLINITDIYPDGECGYYYIEGTYATGAVYMDMTNPYGDLYVYDNGTFEIINTPCGESVTIYLYNDQHCISAQKTITYNCCGTACTLQTVEIDTATCDGNRIYSIEGDFAASCPLKGYSIVDSADGSFVTRWDDIVADIYSVLTNPVYTIINECCDFSDLEISWSNVGDIVTISIINSPVTFSHLVISGSPCAGNIYFDHSACNYQMKSCLFYSDIIDEAWGETLPATDMEITYMGNIYTIEIPNADFISIGAYTYNQAVVDAINAAAIPGFSAILPTEGEITANPYSMGIGDGDIRGGAGNYMTSKYEVLRLKWIDGESFTIEYGVGYNITETNSHTASITIAGADVDLAPVSCVYE